MVHIVNVVLSCEVSVFKLCERARSSGELYVELIKRRTVQLCSLSLCIMNARCSNRSRKCP